MRPLNSICLLVASAVVLGGCGGEDAPASTTQTTQTLLGQPTGADVATDIGPLQLGGGEPGISIDDLGINMGEVDAPVKVIEFVDFGCGFCRRFHEETFPLLSAEYIDTGKIEWKLLPFVAGMFANSEAVTQASECALHQSLSAYAAFTSLLWGRQGDWKGSDDPEALSREWMGVIGADVEAYDTCMEQGTQSERVRSSTAVAAQLGVRSTPTFWVVGAGPILGALPVDTFRQVFDAVYDQMSQSGG